MDTTETRSSKAARWAAEVMRGATLQQIGDREGISRERVRQVIDAEGLTEMVHRKRAEDRAAQRAAREAAEAERKAAQLQAARERKLSVHPSTNPMRYSDDDILTALRTWLEDGGSGVGDDWPGPPSQALVVARFGTWLTALHKAQGLPAPKRKARSDRRGDGEILDGLVMFLLDESEVNGGPGSYDRWRARAGTDYLSSALIRVRFGGWGPAKKAAMARIAAGDIGPSPTVTHPPVWSDDEILGALREWLAAGGSGRTRDWARYGGQPSEGVIRSRFGTWPDAILAAGGTLGGSRWSDDQVRDAVAEFIRMHEPHERTTTAYTSWSPKDPATRPSYDTVRKRYGSLATAIREVTTEHEHREVS